MTSRLLWLLVVLGLCGCSPAPQEVGTVQETSATSPKSSQTLPPDDLGRAIVLKSVPRRIVSIGPGVTETLFALGAGSRLAGRDSGSDYPSPALKVPVVGDYSGPFPEKVVAARPDLIIVQGETYDRARADLWQKKCGVPLAVLTSRTVKQVGQGIGKIGMWLGVPGAANKIAASFAHQAGVASLISRDDTAFFEVSRSPLWAAGRGTLIDDVMKLAGLANVAEVKGYKAFSVETLAVKNPYFYIVAEVKPDRERVLQQLRAHSALGKLSSVRAGRVVVVPADLVLRPGPRLLQGIAVLLKQSQPRRRVLP